MNYKSIIVCIYALLVFGGGVIGYITAGSDASLIMGGSFGVLLFLCGISMNQGHSWGYWISLALSGVLFTFFGFRFIQAYKFMPSGLMGILTLIVVGILAAPRTFKRSHE